MKPNAETLLCHMGEIEEYFDNRADADHDDTGFVPNKEMRLLQETRAAIELIKQLKDRTEREMAQ